MGGSAGDRGHTVTGYDRELATLRRLVLEMGEIVLQQVRDAIAALCEADIRLARRVIRRESGVDNMDMVADESVTRLLAMRQPLACDLRLVVALSKTVTDLEATWTTDRIVHFQLPCCAKIDRRPGQLAQGVSE
jgi:phosphate transport system protein